MKKYLSLIVTILTLAVSYQSSALDPTMEGIMEYERKARQGDHQIQYKLGLMSEFGIKVNKDLYEAKKWYIKADKGGVIRATTRLGVMSYEEDRYSEALKYFDKAMKENEPLSIIYYGKNKLRLNKIEEAEKYFKKAIELGSAQAYFEYGVLKGDYLNNYYLGYINTKIAEVKGYKKAKTKSNEYKSKLSSKQLYSANDRIKRNLREK